MEAAVDWRDTGSSDGRQGSVSTLCAARDRYLNMQMMLCGPVWGFRWGKYETIEIKMIATKLWEMFTPYYSVGKAGYRKVCTKIEKRMHRNWRKAHKMKTVWLKSNSDLKLDCKDINTRIDTQPERMWAYIIIIQIFFIVGPHFHLDFLDSPPSQSGWHFPPLAFLLTFSSTSSPLALLPLHASSKGVNDGSGSVTSLSSSARTEAHNSPAMGEEGDWMPKNLD
ncbi:hypothetical protein MJT46_012105 [Ovis ammon polii x Ovis aries]|nr:hypothetical protein MJT46_012105 [Ovis ammon polii x Ovis aries]